MRLILFDTAVNVALLAADVAVLLLLWKKRDLKWLGTALAGYGAAVFLGVILSMGVVGMFGAMRAMAWTIFIHGVALFTGSAALLWRPRRKVAIGSAAAGLLIALVGIDAFFIEPHWLEVTRVRLTSPKLKQPLKIAIIADIQTDVIGDYERETLRRVAAENPDLVLYAGDYIQVHDDERRGALMQQLRQAIKDAGFWAPGIAVEGNCDHDDWTSIFQGTSVTAVRHTTTTEERGIIITQLSLGDADRGVTITPSDRFHIAVGHYPDFALNDAVKADLLVAGHTHGGQVRLPFIGPLITLSSVPRSWAAGTTKLSGNRTLVVSRGIGMERGAAPRLRFLCRPEVVIVDVVPPP